MDLFWACPRFAGSGYPLQVRHKALAQNPHRAFRCYPSRESRRVFTEEMFPKIYGYGSCMINQLSIKIIQVHGSLIAFISHKSVIFISQMQSFLLFTWALAQEFQ